MAENPPRREALLSMSHQFTRELRSKFYVEFISLLEASFPGNGTQSPNGTES